jgi:hypothetical protein
MSETPERRLHISDQLLAWTEGGIVLFAQHADDQWHLARGWRHADCLTDIRRWSFDSADRFAGQVRRLVYEVANDQGVASRMATVANDWALDLADEHPDLN